MTEAALATAEGGALARGALVHVAELRTFGWIVAVQAHPLIGVVYRVRTISAGDVDALPQALWPLTFLNGLPLWLLAPGMSRA